MTFTPGKYPRKNPYTNKNSLSLIDPMAFNALIRDQGCRVLHESASLCPCYYGRIESGQQKLQCDRCENGYLTYDQTEISVYMENTDIEKQFLQFGVWDSGTAHMYSPSLKENGDEFYIGYFDRITVLDFLEIYSEVIQRGAGDVDVLKYKALDVQILRTEDTEYRPDIDFQLNDDGNVKWVSETQPRYDLSRGVGEVYTIRYLRNPVYRVMEIFHENRFVLTGVKSKFKLPKRLVQECLLRKDYLITKTNTTAANVGQGNG